jgi:hypothetical protein
MLRCAWVLRSMAMERASPFTQSALRALSLHHRHRELVTSADGDRSVNDASLQRIENEFEELLDRLRVTYTAQGSLEVSKFYTQRVHAAMLYFKATDDPLFRQIESRLGKISGDPRLTAARKPRATTLKAYQSGDQPMRNSADYLRVVKSSRLQEQHPAARAEEFPAPPEDFLAEQNSRDGYTKLPDGHRGHWVLRDPGIGITKTERRLDPW